MTHQKDDRLNLQDLFEEYAWGQFNKGGSLFSRLVNRRSKFVIDVQWGSIDFKHKTEKFNERTDEVDAKEDSVSVRAKPKISEIILYESKYENRTPVQQGYNFSSTRDTKNSTTVQLQESYTIGKSCNLEISVPGDIVNLGGGLNNSLNVTKAETETFETTTSWTVDTQINVEKWHRAVATVNVSEKNYVADFVVKTTMKLIDGQELFIAIRRVSDNKLMQLVIVTDLPQIFSEYKERNSKPKLEFVEYMDYLWPHPRKLRKVIITSRGTCKSKSWKNQHVEVHSKRISSSSCEEDESTNDQ